MAVSENGIWPAGDLRDKNVDESSKSGGLKSCFQTHSNHILLLNLLVVYLPLWKIWKSVGILIPNIKMFQTTNQLT